MKTDDALKTYRTKRKIAQQRFGNAQVIEKQYARQLRQVAKQIGHLVTGMSDEELLADSRRIEEAMKRYSDLLNPWAKSVAKKMLAQVGLRNDKAWHDLGKEIGRNLNIEIQSTPTGNLMVELLNEQVSYITSMPLKAAQRVHELTLEGITKGTRASEITKEILRSGKVSEGKAKLIARTEVARTASILTQARSAQVGSEGYFWRTVKDADVRHSHKEMEGKFIKWSDPPTLSDGTTTHAGQIFNCRCHPEPYLPELD